MNYNHGAAAIMFEEARKAYFANKLRYAETYWAKKHLHKSQVASLKSRPIPVPEPAPAQAELKPVKARLPQLPIDVSQPGFVWPAAFGHPTFTASREKMTVLFAQRAPGNSGVGSENFVRIQNTTAEMRSLLSDLVRDMPPMAYLEGKQFLDRIAYEAAQPVTFKVAAVN
jgi:hypothetical protein